jgi:hypothetical protein
MTVVLSSAQVTKASADDDLAEVIVHVHARIVAPARARRTANGWLCLEVGDRMLAADPELLVSDRLIWRVPVQWTSPTTGVLAQSVGQIMVDAVTGEILANQATAQEMQQRVAAIAQTIRPVTPW